MMLVNSLAIPDVKLIMPKKFGDGRGFFSETYNRKAFADAGIACEFVQDNHSFSLHKGTVRGLHFQTPPFAQDKLVRVSRGAIFDVAVDIRAGSPSFGRYVSAMITADNWTQIFIPAGFAHGLVTLEPETEVIYKVSNFYSRDHDKGLSWTDPDVGIDWPVGADEAILSDKDKTWPRLADLPAHFQYAAGGRP